MKPITQAPLKGSAEAAEAPMSDSRVTVDFTIDATPLERAIARAQVQGVFGTNRPGPGDLDEVPEGDWYGDEDGDED
jgi:hypothetical protein